MANCFVCSKCGKEYDACVKFYNECGGKVQKKSGYICLQCGKVYDSAVKFCNECGAKIGTQAPAEYSGSVNTTALPQKEKINEAERDRLAKRIKTEKIQMYFFTICACVAGYELWNCFENFDKTSKKELIIKAVFFIGAAIVSVYQQVRVKTMQDKLDKNTED